MRDIFISLVRGEEPKAVAQFDTNILDILLNSPNELFYEYGIEKHVIDNLRERIRIELLARSLGISTQEG